MRLAFLCLLACVPAIGQPFPPMYWGDDSRLGRPFAKDPCAVSFKGRYLLFCSLPPFADKREENGWAIGIAESADLLNWKKIAELAPEQACERKGFCAPEALVLDGRVHLFYLTYGNGAADAICHAVSDDGVRFRRDASNPVFHPTGDWTCGRAIDAEAIADGSRVLLYFAARESPFVCRPR